MEIYEILDGRLYQSGAPQEAAEWDPIHARGIDVVIDLFGALDRGMPTMPNSILYIFWPIEDVDVLPALGILSTIVDALVAMKILGIGGREALDLVRRQRPGALGNAAFVQHLESLPAPTPAALPVQTPPAHPAGQSPWGAP